MKTSTYIIIGVIAVIAVFFILRPAIFGNVIKWAEEKDDLKSTIQNLNQTISTCNELNKETSAELETAKEDLAKCESDFTKFKKECADDKDALNSKYDDLDTEFRAFKVSYDQLVEKSARSICCKAKIDNININFYSVEGNKIVCLESGENELKCW